MCSNSKFLKYNLHYKRCFMTKVAETKIQKRYKVWLDYIKKRRAWNKKNEQTLPSPSPPVRKALMAFLFYFTSNCYLKINLSFYLQKKTSVTYWNNWYIKLFTLILITYLPISKSKSFLLMKILKCNLFTYKLISCAYWKTYDKIIISCSFPTAMQR